MFDNMGELSRAGWADDKPVPIVGFACEKCFEVYSGNTNPDLTGGVDETPEQVTLGNLDRTRWSIMMAGTSRRVGSVTASSPRLAYSIEELSTVDFEKVPSRGG